MSVKIENAVPPIPAEQWIDNTNWTIDHQLEFVLEYNRMARSPGIMQLFAMVFPIQHFLLGRWGIGIYFLSSAPIVAGAITLAAVLQEEQEELAGIFGVIGFAELFVWLIWYVVEWFLTQRRVREYNQAVAEGLFQRFNRIIQP